MIRVVKIDPRKTATDVTRYAAEQLQLNLSSRTVRCRLCEANLFAHRPAKKPLISIQNRKARLSFARRYQHWSKSDWEKVLWSDESKFNLFSSDGIRYIRRPHGQRYNPRYQVPTVKHGGGSVMVWGCFSRNGVGPIRRIQGIMTALVYKELLETTMLPYANEHMPQGWTFQQDNDPKHTSRLVKSWFSKENVSVLEWPSQSPDLNPIEHLWEELERRIRVRTYKNSDNLMAGIEQEWSEIPIDRLIALVDSMPARCAAVIASNGYATKY